MKPPWRQTFILDIWGWERDWLHFAKYGNARHFSAKDTKISNVCLGIFCRMNRRLQMRHQHNRSRRFNRAAGHAIDDGRRQRRNRARHHSGIQKQEFARLREADLDDLLDIVPYIHGVDKAGLDNRLQADAAAVKPLALDAARQPISGYR